MSRKVCTVGLIFILCLSLFITGCSGDAGTVAGQDAPAASGDVITWKVQGYGAAETLWDEYGKNLADTITSLSGGRLTVEWYAEGTIVPVSEAISAVSNGILDGEFGYSGMWTSYELAAPLFCSTPGDFSDPWDYVMWLERGGGLELWQEMVGKQGMVVIPAGLENSEIFCWSKKPIKTIDDIKSASLRMMPLMGDVLNQNGGNVVFLSAAEIFPSLERGVVDGAEYSIPALDLSVGMQDIADYYTINGFHQPSVIQSLTINEDSWNALPEDLKEVVKSACKQNMIYTWTDSVPRNIEALKKFDEMGKTRCSLTEDTVATLSEWTNAYFEQKKSENDYFKRVRQSQEDFLKWYVPYKESVTLPYGAWVYK